MSEPDQMQKKMLRTPCAGGGSSPVLESIPLSAQTGKDGSWKWTVWATETSGLTSSEAGWPDALICLQASLAVRGKVPLSTGVSLCSGLQLNPPDHQGLLVLPTGAGRTPLTVNIKFVCPRHSGASQGL